MVVNTYSNCTETNQIYFRERFGSLEKSSIFAARFALFFWRGKSKQGIQKQLWNRELFNNNTRSLGNTNHCEV